MKRETRSTFQHPLNRRHGKGYDFLGNFTILAVFYDYGDNYRHNEEGEPIRYEADIESITFEDSDGVKWSNLKPLIDMLDSSGPSSIYDSLQEAANGHAAWLWEQADEQAVLAHVDRNFDMPTLSIIA